MNPLNHPEKEKLIYSYGNEETKRAQNENDRFRQNGQKSAKMAKIGQKSKLSCFIEFHANETWPKS